MVRNVSVIIVPIPGIYRLPVSSAYSKLRRLETAVARICTFLTFSEYRQNLVASSSPANKPANLPTRLSIS
jgi:hypothetical protein